MPLHLAAFQAGIGCGRLLFAIDDVEYATLEWVDWFNNRRLLAPIGNVPPAEYEQMYYGEVNRSCKAA